MVEATYRWLLTHSALGTADGLLLGASSIEQLSANLAACAAVSAGALPDGLRAALDAAAGIAEADAFPYWRSYSKDMPGREDLPQGASYNANKVNA
mmetsp:Transcript_47984/g.102505  ORF Transcript_47984/g.102505 Transcript_47984/m.102505 type:complete len:96 (-) Transcript_47984:236-523(-)